MIFHLFGELTTAEYSLEDKLVCHTAPFTGPSQSDQDNTSIRFQIQNARLAQQYFP